MLNHVCLPCLSVFLSCPHYIHPIQISLTYYYESFIRDTHTSWDSNANLGQGSGRLINVYFKIMVHKKRLGGDLVKNASKTAGVDKKQSHRYWYFNWYWFRVNPMVWHF